MTHRTGRRPKTRTLAALYDEGFSAPPGTPNPYHPRQNAGDDTRQSLWQDGYDDATLDRDIDDLV